MRRDLNVSRRIAMTSGLRTGRRRLVLSIVVGVAGFLWTYSTASAQMQPVATSTAETAPIPASQIPKEVTDAINAPDRPAADKALDAGRRPDQIMAFYEI